MSTDTKKCIQRKFVKINKPNKNHIFLMLIDDKGFWRGFDIKPNKFEELKKEIKEDFAKHDANTITFYIAMLINELEKAKK